MKSSLAAWALANTVALRGDIASCVTHSDTSNQFRSRKSLRIAIVTWIQRTYHHRHRQDHLDRLTPVEFETMTTKTLTLAA